MPGNFHSSRSTCFISQGLPVDGIPSISLNEAMPLIAPASNPALYGGR